MMCSVFCVPMLSVDFEGLPPRHRHITGRWIDFYHRSRELITFGRFEPEIPNAGIETIRIHDGERAVLGLFHGPSIPFVPKSV